MFMLAQIEVATELANNILQAQLTQVIGLVLVIVMLVLAVFTVIFFRIINVVARQTEAMAKKTENDSKIIESMGITNHAIEHINNALDDQTLYLGRIDDGMKANIALNTERNTRSDVMAISIKSLSDDSKQNTDKITSTISDELKARDPKSEYVVELLVDANKKLDEVLNLLRNK